MGPPRDPLAPGYASRPWYGRSWGYYNRPRVGCGCLSTLLLILLLSWLLSFLFTPLAFWF